jgi:hypothetical protein
MRLFYKVAKTVLTLGIGGCLPAFAAFTTISTPASSYTGGTTLLPLPAPNCLSPSSISSVTGGGQTVTLSPPMFVRQVGTGLNFCGWSNWGTPPATEGSTPVVITTTQLSVTLTLSVPSATFGFEVTPSQSCPIATPCPFLVTATFYNGATVLGTIPLSIDGNAAALEAASSTTPITSVTIAAAAGSNGFALAQLRFTAAPAATVPTVRTGVLGGLTLLLAAGGSLLARRQAQIRTVRP